MKIGLITYHAAYNYGSVLQAYATQCAIEKTGNSVEMINYRMAEQRNVYCMYRTKFGLKTLIKDLLQIPIHSQRRERCNKFEQFINKYMNLSGEYLTPEEVSECWDKYELIVSGSDQIWNKHSLELENNEWGYMAPYLLEGYSGKKVSYASSIANMTDDELLKIVQSIKDFSYVSLREISSIDRIQKFLTNKVRNVVDPTFLLTAEEWIALLGLKKRDDEKYILYYTLESYGTLRKNIKSLKKIAGQENKKVFIVSPFAYIPIFDNMVKIIPMLGPEEFLDMIYNADKVITNSYHGTILSVNLKKDIYSVCESIGSEFRKTDILTQLGMEERIIGTLDALINMPFHPINYVQVHEKLSVLRDNSNAYLREAVSIHE